MLNNTYMIIYSGMTADASVEGIRQTDPNDSIGLISAEPPRPYDRPPLSKGLWKGKPLESIWRKATDQGVNLHLGRRALSLDLQAKRVTDDQGTVYSYDKLLLATGGTPRRLSFGGDRIIYFRTLDDYQRLRALAAARPTVRGHRRRVHRLGGRAAARSDRRTSKAGCRPETPAGAAYSTHEPTSKGRRTSWDDSPEADL